MQFKEIDAVLSECHQINEEEVGAFRARVRNLRRLGIPIGIGSGKGKRENFTLEHLYQLGFALELTQFSMNPSFIATLTKTYWPELAAWIDLALENLERRLHLRVWPATLKRRPNTEEIGNVWVGFAFQDGAEGDEVVYTQKFFGKKVTAFVRGNPTTATISRCKQFRNLKAEVISHGGQLSQDEFLTRACSIPRYADFDLTEMLSRIHGALENHSS